MDQSEYYAAYPPPLFSPALLPQTAKHDTWWESGTGHPLPYKNKTTYYCHFHLRCEEEYTDYTDNRSKYNKINWNIRLQ